MTKCGREYPSPRQYSVAALRRRHAPVYGFARAFLNIFDIMPRTREAGTTAFMMRFRRPGIIEADEDSAIMSRLTSPRAPFAAR
jgi:hypothetical protein